MNSRLAQHNYIWLSSDFKKIYLFERTTQILDFLSEEIIKKINLIVSYDHNNNYGICYDKTENKENLNYTNLLNEHIRVKDFFGYFKNSNLNCAEFDIELLDGTILKTFYGNDLILIAEDITVIHQILATLPEKLIDFYKDKKNTCSKIIKYDDTAILSEKSVAEIEDFLFSNEAYFFNL
jgi:hypothetical protein